MVFFTHPLDPPGVAGKDEHADQIGHRCGHGLEALLIGHRGPAHHGAAADDTVERCVISTTGPQGPAGHVEVVGVFDALDEPHAYQQHTYQIQAYDPQIQCGNFRHCTLLSHLWPEERSASVRLKKDSRLGGGTGGKGQLQPQKKATRV